MDDKPTFYNFRNGVHISDTALNIWIEQCVEKIRQTKESHVLRSGDSMVSAFWFDDQIMITVSTSDGYSAVRINHDEEVPKYKRGSEQ